MKADPPQIDAPSWADEACRIGSLPESELTQAELESALYGAWDVIAICRKAIGLEQEAHAQERQAVADWIEE